MTSHCINHTIASVVLSAISLNAQPFQPSAAEHLRRALRLAELNNWIGAENDFTEAERMFTAVGDLRNALYARLGRIRATGGGRSLDATSAQLARLRHS